MSDAFLPMDARPEPFEGRDRFLPALGIALLAEAALIAAFMHVQAPKAIVKAARPQIVKIQMLAPPAPKPIPPPPKPVPPPPQPVPKPPPPPPPPKPVARPLPKPVPKPLIKPKPLPRPLHRVIHRPVRKPRPVAPIEHPVQPPPPPAPAVSAAEQASAAELYAATLRSKVQANTQVPEAVTMMHLSGVATIEIELAPSGQLIAVSILRSSGVPLIDHAAMASVRATSFPPFPEKMPRHPMVFTLRVRLSGG
jgi:protein TonB